MKDYSRFGYLCSGVVHATLFASLVAFSYLGFSSREDVGEGVELLNAQVYESVEMDFSGLSEGVVENDFYLSLPEPSPVQIALDEIIETMELSQVEESYVKRKIRDEGIDKMLDSELMSELEKKVRIAERIPKEHLEEIDEMVRSNYGIKERTYAPLEEVEFLKREDSAVPYFRVVERDGESYFQELSVNEFGEFIIAREILESEMEFNDKKNLKIYQITEPISQIRNTALSIILGILDGWGE